MRLNLVTGRSGSGKTEYCIREMLKIPSEKRVIYIVPEQFTLESEKRLTTLKRSLINIDVISFNRLRFHISAETGPVRREFLDDESKGMILRRLLAESSGSELKYTADKPGVISNIGSIISEFYRFGVRAEVLEGKLKEMEGKSENPSFTGKMRDILDIYKRYSDFMAEKYISSDMILDYVADKIRETTIFDGSFVFIDGFNSFTAQEYRVMTEIMALAEETTVTLCLDGQVDSLGEDVLSDPFYETKKAYIKILEIFRKLFPSEGNIKNIRLKGGGRGEALSFFEKNFFEFNPPVYEGEQNEISIIGGVNKKTETAAVCSRIAELTKKGFRYRDMAVILCDPSYMPILRGELKKRGIPDFTDTKTPVLTHPCSVFILSLVNMTAFGMKQKDVFTFLKTGLSPLEDMTISRLEKYVIAHGVEGYRWKYEMTEENAETGRQKLLEIIKPLNAAFGSGGSFAVRDINRKIFEVLENCGFYDKYRTLIEGEENSVLKSRYKQVWEQLVSTFDKAEEFLGDQQVTLEEYGEILRAGLGEKSVAEIPLYSDSLIIGDVARTRLPHIRAMFVMGAVRGALPEQFTDSGLISDSDREIMKENGMEIAGTSDEQLSLNYLRTYQVLTKPTEKLTLSYPLTTASGDIIEPSEITELIRGMMNVETVVCGEEINAPQNREPFMPKEDLSPETAAELNGTATYLSSSRIDGYINCPFSYFLKYVLKLKEDKVYGIDSLDKGNIMHSIMEKFFRENPDALLSDEETEKMVAELMPEVLSRCLPGMIEEDKKNVGGKLRYFFSLIERTAKTSVKAGLKQIREESFVPSEFEVSFGGDESGFPPVKIDKNIKLVGKIDRVDLFEKDGNLFVKIIDYKSSARIINLDDIHRGLKLQLILYLRAYISEKQKKLKNSETVRPSGFMYFTMTDPKINEDKLKGMDPAEYIKDSFKPSGVVSDNEDNISALSDSVNKDRGIIKMSEESLDGLMDESMNKAAEIGEKIRKGRFPVYPYKRNSGYGCDYCPYSGICEIDIDKTRVNKL